MNNDVYRVEIQPTILYKDSNTENKMYRGRIENSDAWELESESSDKLRSKFISKYSKCIFLFQQTKDFTIS